MSDLGDALFSAAQRGLVDRVTSLLAGVDVRDAAVQDAMCAALQVAVCNDHAAAMCVLCDAGASFGLATCRFDILYLLPGHKQLFRRSGFQPIHLAASVGSSACIDALVERFEVSPNLRDGERNRGKTPLHWSCLFAHVGAVRQLLAAKAHVGFLSMNRWNETVLDAAVCSRDTRVVAAILKSRPDADTMQRAIKRALGPRRRAVLNMVSRALSSKIASDQQQSRFGWTHS